MGLSYLWSYMYYLSAARSEYFVHSPFVYTLMTECLRKKRRFFPENRDRLLERISGYLAAAEPDLNILRITPDEPIKHSRTTTLTAENTMLFIDLPHKGTQREAQWNDLCRNPDITLTIDLFRAGLVFPRREMRKEHFCLRYF